MRWIWLSHGIMVTYVIVDKKQKMKLKVKVKMKLKCPKVTPKVGG